MIACVKKFCFEQIADARQNQGNVGSGHNEASYQAPYRPPALRAIWITPAQQLSSTIMPSQPRQPYIHRERQRRQGGGLGPAFGVGAVEVRGHGQEVGDLFPAVKLE